MTPIRPQRGLAKIEPYVPGKPVEEVQREYGLRDVVKLASNENPLGPSPRAVAAIREALARVNIYPDGQSYYLRQALARHLGLDAEQVTVGNGADGIIVQICLAYLEEGDEVIVSRTSFPVYDVYTHVMRATLVKTPLREYGIDLKAMARAINKRTKIVFVCNPNNPTGTIVTAAEVEDFLTVVPDRVLVVFDEAYYEFVDTDAFPDTLRYVRDGRQNVMTIRTFSKVYGLAGIRLGYAAGAPQALAPLNVVREPFAVNLLAQAAGLAALEDEEFLRAAVAVNHTGRLYLYREFERLGLFFVRSHTNFVLVRVGPRAGEVARAMLERGVIVRPCGGYDLDEFLRITVGDPEQNERLVASLEGVLQEFRSPGG